MVQLHTCKSSTVHNSNFCENFFVDITTTHHNITGLQPNWNYTVTIQAFTQEGGDGSDSENTTVATTAQSGEYNRTSLGGRSLQDHVPIGNHFGHNFFLFTGFTKQSKNYPMPSFLTCSCRRSIFLSYLSNFWGRLVSFSVLYFPRSVCATFCDAPKWSYALVLLRHCYFCTISWAIRLISTYWVTCRIRVLSSSRETNTLHRWWDGRVFI